MNLKINKKITLAFQYIMAIAIIAWIFLKIDIGKLSDVFLKIAWWTFPVIIIFTLGSMVIQAFRWWLLLRAFTDEIRFSRALAYHLSSIFYAMVLPTSAAQEVLRTLYVVKKAGASVSWGAAWICKISGLGISLLFSLFGLLYMSRLSLPHGTLSGLFIFCGLTIVFVFLSFSKRFTSPLRRFSATFIPFAFLNKIENIREGVYRFRTKKKTLFETIGLTIAIQIIFTLNLALVIQGITGTFYFWECLAFMPLIEIISMAQPLTPGGMGVREALTAMMFKYIGLSKEQLGMYIIVILSSSLLRIVGVIPVLYGAAKLKNIPVPANAKP